MQKYFTTVNEFLRLESIVFGDIKGQVLTDLVATMYTDFTDLITEFQEKGLNPLNLSSMVRS